MANAVRNNDEKKQAAKRLADPEPLPIDFSDLMPKRKDDAAQEKPAATPAAFSNIDESLFEDEKKAPSGTIAGLNPAVVHVFTLAGEELKKPGKAADAPKLAAFPESAAYSRLQADERVAIAEIKRAFETGNGSRFPGEFFLTRDQKLERIISRLETAVEKKPDDPALRIKLGSAYSSLGEDAKAVASLIEAVRLDGGSAEALKKLGAAYTRQEDWSGATDVWNRLLKTTPRDPDVYVGLAIACNGQDDAAGMHRNLGFAEYLRGNQARGYYHRGMEYVLEAGVSPGKLDEGIRYLERASAMAPDDVEVWLSLSKTFESKGMAFDAERCAKEAIRAHRLPGAGKK